MKKTILLLALFLSTFAFSQTFKKAIISENTHIYNPVKNLECRMIRAINPKNGVQFSDESVTIYIQVHGLILENYTDEKGVENTREKIFELPQYAERIVYSKEEVDYLFSQIKNPIDVDESFFGELNNLIEISLLGDTLRKGYFNGDNFEIYNAAKN
jgi:hypothetical protein